MSVLVAATWVAATSVAAAGPPPIADFFRHPAVSAAVMSPNGVHVAALMSGGPDNRQRLVIVDLQDVAASKVIAAHSDADIANVRWVNDERLVYAINDRQSALGDQPGEGLFSVGRDGAQMPRRLIKPRQYFLTEPLRPGDRELSVYHRFHSVLRDGSNDVLVSKALVDNLGEWTATQLLRLDTVSGRTRLLTPEAPAGSVGWAVDAQGAPRVVFTAKDGKSGLYWKPKADAAGWTLVREAATYVGTGSFPQVLRIDAEGLLYAVAPTGGGKDTQSLARIDLRGGGYKVEPLVTLAGFDFQGSLVFDPRGRLLGVHYLSDARASYWYDPALKEIQAKVDALLPATVNRLDCGDCSEPSRVLVTSQSDRQPAIFRIYDVASGRLDVLAGSRPWIDPTTMASRDFQRFKARDGLEIPVHVTRPRGQTGTAPAVVLVHGGPWVRGGEWRWDADSQFLASRGYVVIEPEFRGSTGFGGRLFRAGFKQWGLAMQDDVADAARWAVQQGFADPKRIAIAGASYGGYATLMGLIRDPNVFRCGIAWAAVSDINLMYSIEWSDSSQMWKRYGMPVLVGDREKDAAQLTATSPLQQAARLKLPLLMAHGSDDYRVPLDHATRMRDALRGHNPNVEFVIYAGEGHGWMLESTRVDFWGRVERFLARYLAAAP